MENVRVLDLEIQKLPTKIPGCLSSIGRTELTSFFGGNLIKVGRE